MRACWITRMKSLFRTLGNLIFCIRHTFFLDFSLLGEFMFDEQSFIKIPSQIHTNLSFSKNLHSINKIASQNYLLDIDHPHLNSQDSHQFYQSLSHTSLPVDSNGDFNLHTSTRATSFHLFDLPNEDFEKISINPTGSSQSLPRRPPPPPLPSTTQPLVNTALLEDSLLDIIEPVKAPSPSPLEFNVNSSSVHFTKPSTATLINIFESVKLPPPLPPIPSAQPRSKFHQKKSDLLLLGDPGSPAPPLPTPLLTFTKPSATDFDLLGDPGSPPPTPPPI